MKSRVLQFLCSIHIIYVELPQWNFFLSREGRRVETEINLLNLLYVNSTRTLQIRNVRPRDVTWLVLVAEGPVAEPGFEPRALPLECVLLICLIETPSGEASPGAVRRAGGELVGGTAFGTPWL